MHHTSRLVKVKPHSRALLGGLGPEPWKMWFFLAWLLPFVCVFFFFCYTLLCGDWIFSEIVSVALAVMIDPCVSLMHKGVPAEPWGLWRLNSSQPGPSPSNSLNLREAQEVHCGSGSGCCSPQVSQAVFPGGLSLAVTWHWARAAVPPGTL